MPTETLAPPGFDEAVTALCPDGPPRVWSLIVTVFGDTGGEIEIGAGPLARILGSAGVSGAAMRVALHRLKSDGWIKARRVGRSSAYKLHPDRLAETRAASSRIYAPASPEPSEWHLVALAPEASAEAARGEAVQIAPRLMLKAGSPGPHSTALALQPHGPVPSWLRAKLATAELRQAYAALLAGLSVAEQLTQEMPTVGAEAIALRVLVVHAWRRVILRHPDLPDALFGDDWPAPACRDQVQRLLSRFAQPDADTLAAL